MTIVNYNFRRDEIVPLGIYCKHKSMMLATAPLKPHIIASMADGKHEKSDETNPKARAGIARAKSLTKAQRMEIARRAAQGRWDVMSATHGDPNTPLVIGNAQLPCYVLEDGTRVFSQTGMLSALSLTPGGGVMPRFIERISKLAPTVVEQLRNPIRFRQPRGGPLAFGYPVELLIDICNAVLEAHDDDELPETWELVAERAGVFVRAVAKVGIIALVDEVTGYQDVRHREALQAILDAYLRPNYTAAWAKRFPDEFYKEMFRLRSWDWHGAGKSGHAVAQYTKDLVYARIAPDLLQELERRNPVVGKGRKVKHHQWLTEDIGVPRLSQHLHTVIHFMRAADDWDQFKSLIDRALPVQDVEQLKLDLQRDE